MSMFRTILVFIVAVVCLKASGQLAPLAVPVTPFKAVVTVAPLRGLVEPLLPAGSELTMLMQPGRSEHGYEFTPGDLAKLAEADLVVYVGLGLEPMIADWLAQNPDPTRRVVEFAAAVEIKPADPDADPHAGHDHEHDATCEHNHSGPDQHLWLDPVLVRRLIPVVRDSMQHALADQDASDETRRTVNAAADKLITRIERVDAEWAAAFAAAKGVSIVTHHNAFGRPAARYGFEVAETIRTREGEEPSPADLARIVGSIKSRKVKAIFVEPQFNPKVANRIAKAAKVKVASLDPLGTGDWFALMDANLKSIIENTK